jgi:hypothetical protein
MILKYTELILAYQNQWPLKCQLLLVLMGNPSQCPKILFSIRRTSSWEGWAQIHHAHTHVYRIHEWGELQWAAGGSAMAGRARVKVSRSCELMEAGGARTRVDEPGAWARPTSPSGRGAHGLAAGGRAAVGVGEDRQAAITAIGVGAQPRWGRCRTKRRSGRTAKSENFLRRRPPLLRPPPVAGCVPPATPDSLARMRCRNEMGKKQRWELGVSTYFFLHRRRHSCICKLGGFFYWSLRKAW